MRLSTRLLLLVLLCLTPVISVEVFTQLELRQKRQSELGEIALRQVELWNGSLASIVEGARQLLIAVSEFRNVRALDPGCANQLRAIQAHLPAYRFIAVLAADGHLVCASVSEPAPEIGELSWGPEALQARVFSTGRYENAPGESSGFLPFFLPLGGSDPRAGVLVAALDLSWLGTRMTELRSRSAPGFPNSTLLIADREGTIVYRFPDPDRWIGRPVRPESLSLVHASHSGVAVATGFDGKERIVGYNPATQDPAGLFVASGLYIPDATADIDATSRRGGLLIFAALVLALLIAWLVGRRSIGMPTRRLLAAARRWREGDLSARAELCDDTSEFGKLAQAFNEMAAALKTRDAERIQHAHLLETRVAERTRELSESNNRLQVEIAERERTEVALHQAQKLQAVGQLAGGVAHDFNNMLATVLGNLELMERRLPSGDDRLRPWIERAIGAVQRGAQLTSRLLAFSRRQRLAPQPTDLNRLIGELATLAASTLGRRVQIATDLSPDLWLALVDRSQIEAAILNLALNARDAMPEGGMLTIATANETIASRVGGDDAEPGDYIRVAVADTGAGMPPDVMRRAFEPFFTTKGPGGSGLGLSQVYGMVRQSGGAVRIRSEAGKGTEVALLLPRAQPEKAGRAEPAALTELRLAASRLVLLVDDDPGVRQVTSEMLTDLGCRVVEACGGEEALQILETQGPTITTLVVDYAMPGMTGLQLASVVRKRGITAPIILATGYAELADPSEGSESLLTMILRKPFTLRQLKEALIRVRDPQPLERTPEPS